MNNNTFARNEGNRVVYYNISLPVGSDFWDRHWEEANKSSSEFYSRYASGDLGYGLLGYIFLKYLPKGGRILEAGCGRGQFLLALCARGYNCMGIDFAFKSILNLKKHFPDIPVMAGDVCHLSMKDQSLDAHSENTLLPDKAVFHQYAFTADEFREFLKATGFTIKSEYGYSLHYAFRLRFKAFAMLLARFPKFSYIDFLTDRLQIGPDNSRMRLYIATKEHGR